MLLTQPLNARWSKLKGQLEEEQATEKARCAVNHHERVSSMANRLAVEQFIPCVLHMEMRDNEKVTFTLFAVGMDRHPDGDSATMRQFVKATVSLTPCTMMHLVIEAPEGLASGNFLCKTAANKLNLEA